MRPSAFPFPSGAPICWPTYPRWVLFPFVLFGGALLVPAVADRGLDLLTRATRRLAGLPAQSLLLAVAGLLLFVTLASAAHLLGDGGLLLNELPHTVRLDIFRVDRAPFLFWILRELHSLGQLFELTAESTFRLYSYASGFAYLLLIPPIARTAEKERPGGALVAGFLLTPACLQLFCGYVETYPLLATGLLLYLWCGLRVLRGELSPAWSAAADQLFALGRFDQAAAAFERAVELRPTLAYAWNWLGVTRYHQGKSTEAVHAFTRATELVPDNAGFLYDLCLTHNRLGRFQEALSACGRAAALRPESGPARNQLIAAAVALGQLETARLHYAQLRRIDPRLADELARALPELREATD